MRTTVCELVFADGARVKATVKTASPESRGLVAYEGALGVLADRHRLIEETHNATLRVAMGNLARELGAELQVKEEGEFEEWAL
jgi:hypothetical protein